MEVKTARQQYLARLLMLAYNQYKQVYREPEPKFYLLPAPQKEARAAKMQAFLNHMLSDLSRDMVIEELRRHQQFVENLDLYHRRVNRCAVERGLVTGTRYIMGQEPNGVVSPPALRYEPKTITVLVEAPPLTYERLQEIREAFNQVIMQGLWSRYPPLPERDLAQEVRGGTVTATCLPYRTWLGRSIVDNLGLVIDEAAQMPGLEEIDEAYMRSYNAQFGGITNQPSTRGLTEIRVPNLPNNTDR